MEIDVKELAMQLAKQMLIVKPTAQQESQSQALEGSKVLFTDFMEEWLEGKKASRCTNTVDKYTSLYRNHLKPAFSGLMLTEITIKALQQFINDKKGVLSTSTIHEIKASILSPALHTAEGRGLITKNPAKFVEIPQVVQKHSRPLQDDEIVKLMNVAKNHRHYIALPLMLLAGIRRGELLALTWSDIDFDKREISIDKNYVQTSSDKCQCKAPKTKSSVRLIAIPDNLLEAFKEHKRKYGIGKTYVISQKHNDKMINPNNFGRLFRSWCDKAGLENVSPHSTRHTYCIIALEVGVDTKTIADQLGHKDTRMLERVYAHRRTNALQQKSADLMGDKMASVFNLTA